MGFLASLLTVLAFPVSFVLDALAGKEGDASAGKSRHDAAWEDD